MFFNRTNGAIESTIDNATAWNLNRTRTHFVDAHIVRITWEPIVWLFDCRFLCSVLRAFPLTAFFSFRMKFLVLRGQKKKCDCSAIRRIYKVIPEMSVINVNNEWWKYFVFNQEEKNVKKAKLKTNQKNTFSCNINKYDCNWMNNERSCRKHLANFHFFTWTQKIIIFLFWFVVCILCAMQNVCQTIRILVRYCVIRLYSEYSL